MKTILCLIASMLLLIGCKNQTSVLALEPDVLYQQAEQALANSDFVLEASYLNYKGRFNPQINSNTNFIALNGTNAIIQFAVLNYHPGLNGIGGITLEGRASNIKMKKDKKGNITYSMEVIGRRLSAQVFLNVIKDTNRCIATIRSNHRGGETTFTGYLYPKEESNFFKGLSL